MSDLSQEELEVKINVLLKAVENRTLPKALHDARCIVPPCADCEGGAEIDRHLAEIALAWVKLRMRGDDVFTALVGVLSREEPECPDENCTWEGHTAVNAVAAIQRTI